VVTGVHANTSVLVVDDDDDIRYAIANILKRCHCEVSEAASVEAAQTAMGHESFGIIFCDMRFHGTGLDGDALLEFVLEHHPSTQVVLISCNMDSQRSAELVNQGAAMCLQKPFFRDTCMQVLAQLQPTDQNTKAA